VVLLRRPQEGTWPENTVDYGIPEAVTRRWFNGRFYGPDNLNGEEWSGWAFRIPLELIAEADPRESNAGGFGDAKSFAYEWVSENDPTNSVRDRGTFDDLEFFDDATTFNQYRLEGETGIEIFIPTLLWDQPEFFEEGSCPTGGPDFCGVGEYLRRQLGQITLTALARQTARREAFVYWSDTKDGEGSSIETEISDVGLVSEARQSSFPVRVGLDDQAGGVLPWPSPNP
jgi:hypothetical protein